MRVHDLVIRRPWMVDGTGAPARIADVAVDGQRISEVGEVRERGSVELDGSGLVLCPGFVDCHSHDDFWVLLEPELPFKVLQGVTTEIVGNCGIGAAPRPAADDWIRHYGLLERLPKYSSHSEYFRLLRDAGPSPNFAVLSGHGALRTHAAPHARGTLGRGELAALERELEAALDAGAIGMSSGLIYEPGRRAGEEELSELGHRLAERGRLYTTHLRNEADELVPAVEEALRVVRRTGVGLQLSHHKAHGRNNWGRVRDSLALVDAAVGEGLDVWLDQYPYTAGSTILEAVARDGGLQGASHVGRLEPSDVVIASAEGRAELEGRSLADLIEDWGVDVTEAAQRVLGVAPGCWVVVHAMAEEDVRTVMRHERVLFGSDGLPTASGRPHPRLWGTFVRLLGHYSRDEGVLGLERAIARMSGWTARRFGLEDRGEIQPGYWADLVLFDAERVADRADYQRPESPPVGIRGVWINGARTVAEGRHTGARAGRVLTPSG